MRCETPIWFDGLRAATARQLEEARLAQDGASDDRQRLQQRLAAATDQLAVADAAHAPFRDAVADGLPQRVCPMQSWTLEDRRIAAPRLALTDRAGRWATVQVGRFGRTVNEVAVVPGCDWHTINATVIAYGEALIDEPDRIGTTTALGLDETLFVKLGPFRAKQWCTSIVDVAAGRLLDIVPGRTATRRPSPTDSSLTTEPHVVRNDRSISLTYVAGSDPLHVV